MKIIDPTVCGRIPYAALMSGAVLLRRMLKAAVLPSVAIVTLAGSAYAGTISPRRLLEVADLGNPVVSPDGRNVAFRLEQPSVERNTYDSVWYVQGLDGTSPPRRVADGGIPLRQYVTGLVVPAPAMWSPDGRWIYYRALLDGKIAVWRAAADGSRSEPITQDPADVREFALSADGRTLKYGVGPTREEVIEAELAEYDRGIRIDDSVFIGAGLFRSSQLEGRLATQRFTGEWFTTDSLLAKVPSRWKAVDLATLATRELPQSEVPPPPPKVSDLSKDLPEPWKVAQHPDDGRIAVLTRIGKQEGFQMKPDVELGMLSGTKSRQLVKCRAELCTDKNITDIQWRPGSDEVLFTVTDRREGRAHSVFLWNVSTGAVRAVTHGKGALSGNQRDTPCALSSGTLVCVAAEADRPPRLEAFDLETGRRQALFDPNAALAADIATRTPAKLVRWTDTRGRELAGWLFEAHRAPGSPPPPLFVTFYTCDGFLRGGLGDEWPLASLAEQGISALCINGRQAYFDVVEHYAQGLHAVESVVDLLAGQGAIDRAKVGMGGLSYGSEVTTWTAMHSDLLVAASVTSPSITHNWYLFNSLRENFRKVAKSNWQLGMPEETPEQWRAISPASNLDKFRAPILFQMPEQEYLVSLDYTLPLVRTNRAELYVFPHEPHIKFQPRHKLAAYERNLDWFRFWLQGFEDEDPAKSAQYARWRQMRVAVAANKSRE